MRDSISTSLRVALTVAFMACAIAAPLYGQVDKADRGVRAYDRSHWGFRLRLPETWNVYREVDVPEEFRVSFGMPKIWSERENSHIENAVSVSVYQSESL